MSLRSDAAPVPLEHFAQSVQCLVCQTRGAERYQVFAWRPVDSDLRRNSMAIIAWVCDECAEAMAGAVVAARNKGPVTR
jgi:formylmethanofuran dehydrogenase subunit E